MAMYCYSYTLVVYIYIIYVCKRRYVLAGRGTDDYERAQRGILIADGRENRGAFGCLVLKKAFHTSLSSLDMSVDSLRMYGSTSITHHTRYIYALYAAQLRYVQREPAIARTHKVLNAIQQYYKYVGRKREPHVRTRSVI